MLCCFSGVSWVNGGWGGGWFTPPTAPLYCCTLDNGDKDKKTLAAVAAASSADLRLFASTESCWKTAITITSSRTQTPDSHFTSSVRETQTGGRGGGG